MTIFEMMPPNSSPRQSIGLTSQRNTKILDTKNLVFFNYNMFLQLFSDLLTSESNDNYHYEYLELELMHRKAQYFKIELNEK